VVLLLFRVIFVSQVKTSFSHRFPLQCYFMSIVDKPIEDRIGDGWIFDVIMPSSNWQLSGHDCE